MPVEPRKEALAMMNAEPDFFCNVAKTLNSFEDDAPSAESNAGDAAAMLKLVEQPDEQPVYFGDYERPQVEPRLASAYPDGQISEAAVGGSESNAFEGDSVDAADAAVAEPVARHSSCSTPTPVATPRWSTTMPRQRRCAYPPTRMPPIKPDSL